MLSEQVALAARMGRISASATVELTRKAAQLRAEGRDILALAAGEPDFDTPAHIRAAAVAALEAGATRYTPPDGIPALKDAVVRKFRTENGIGTTPEQITIAAGGKQVIFAAMLATLQAGDEMVIPAPYWVSYPDLARLAGAQPVIIAPRAGAGLQPDIEALGRAITPRSRWLALNSPCNPSGAMLDRAALAQIAELVRTHPRLLVLSDDIYEHIRYDGRDFATLAQIAPDLADRVLTLNGVSKAYAMTGWRIGYSTGPRWLADAMRVLLGQSTSCPAALSQAAALAALEGPQEFLAEWRKTYQSRRDRLIAGLRDIEGVRVTPPDGAFYAFADVRGLMQRSGHDSATSLAAALLDEVGLALVPGSAFGMEGHLRLSFAAGQDTLDAAIDRLSGWAAKV